MITTKSHTIAKYIEVRLRNCDTLMRPRLTTNKHLHDREGWPRNRDEQIHMHQTPTSAINNT